MRLGKQEPSNWMETLPLMSGEGDMVDMFFCFCFNCGIVIHPNCMDKNVDLVNDARLSKWECLSCVRRASDNNKASSSSRKP